MKQVAVLEMTLTDIDERFKDAVLHMECADDIKKAIDAASDITVASVWEALEDQIEDLGKI